MSESKSETSPFQKEVIRLPDGRELTYYRFPDEAPRPTPGKGVIPPAPDKER